MDNTDNIINSTVFGNWIITEPINEGGFGKVYKLEREEFGIKNTAALKIITIPSKQAEINNLRYEEGYSDEEIAAYFKEIVQSIVKEIALMAKLKGNTNIVGYEDHQVNQIDDFTWEILIRMEYLTPLMEYFSDGCTINDVIKLGIDICNALVLCQKNSIIHRDIKPDNILVSPSGDFKLGDFGIARELEVSVGAFSKKGTYTYMAPEVYKGEDYRANVDIYSLGLVLYRLLNKNKMPFMPMDRIATHTERENAFAMRMSGERLPTPVSAPKPLAEIVLKACAFNPADRYSSPLQMKKELENLLSDDSDIPVEKLFDPVTLKTETKIDSRKQPDAEKDGGTVGPFGGVGGRGFLPEAEPEEDDEFEGLDEDEELEDDGKTFGAFRRMPQHFEPVDNEPEIEEYVERPKKKNGFGKIVAAIALVCVIALSVFAIASVGKNNTNIKSEQTTEIIVPEVRGKNVEKAKELIKNSKLNYNIIRVPRNNKTDVVISQNPEAGEKVKKGDHIDITIGTSNFEIFYDTNKGNKMAQKSKIVEVGNKFGKLPEPTREGYTFAGWFTEKKGGTEITKDSYLTEKFKGNTLFAHWEKENETTESNEKKENDAGGYVALNGG